MRRRVGTRSVISPRRYAEITECVVFTLLMATAPPVLRAQDTPDPTRVLMLYGHDPNAPGVTAFAEQLRAAVREESPGLLEFYDEPLDLLRFDSPERASQLTRSLSEKYRGFIPDAIVAEGSLALRFVTDHLATLFPGVPVVYGLAFEPVVDFDALPANVTGRRQPLPFRGTVELARALQPDAERVVVVAGSSNQDSVVLAHGLRQIEPLLGGMELEVLQDWSYDTLLDSLRRIPARTILILSATSRDQHGQEFNTGDLIPTLTRVASVPVYGIARNWVGDGVVGGEVMDFGGDGRRTGQLLARILRRAPGEPMPEAEVAGTVRVVDWRQLQRWGLPESQLPPGFEVLFRTPTLWERHWPAILTLLGVLAAQSCLIGLLLLERSRRVRAQRELAEQARYEQLIGALTADVTHLPPQREPRALEEALMRVGRFADARAAVLGLAAPDPKQPPTHVFWSDAGGAAGDGSATMGGEVAEPAGSRLELSLVAEETVYGVIELYRAEGEEWRDPLLTRLRAAADVIAAGLARARAAEALEQTRGQLTHIARVATVGELAGAVTHELRQPLTAILANAEAGALLLAKATPQVDEARAIFRDIVRDNVRASQVIEHIGSLLRKQEPTITTVDLNALCQHTAELLDRDARTRGVRLQMALDARPPLTSGDPVQLQQVVMNLALNALEAAGANTKAHEVVVGTAARNGQVEVFVRDTGPGLPSDVRHQVFEPFFSTKPRGLGLGLAIVRTIVQRHRGRVHAENHPTGGALFRVTLPAAEETSERPRSSAGGCD